MKHEDIIFGVLAVLAAASLGLLLIAACAVIPAAILWLAWNQLAVPWFHWPHVTLLQSWLILAVAGIVFRILGYTVRK